MTTEPKATPDYWIQKCEALLRKGKGLEYWSGMESSAAAAYMRPQCEALLHNDILGDLIRQTEENAPCRKDKRLSYCLDERGGKNAEVLLEKASDTSGERKLEAELFLEFIGRPQESLGVPVAYQVPLFIKAKKDGWGYVDLLCYDERSGHPVVVELKRSDNSESPLRAILEGVAYATALKKGNWNSIVEESKGQNVKVGCELKPLSDDTVVRVVVLAPSEYWAPWLGSKSSEKTKYYESARLKALVEKLLKNHACEIVLQQFERCFKKVPIPNGGGAA
jgi:hypothetical protein